MTPNADTSSEIARLTAERDAARAAAEEAERHRDELLSRVAHDLRGPLNSIFGWVQLLQSGRLDPERHRHALEAIARGIRAQTTLLDEMQRVSHTLRDRLELSLGSLDPATPLLRAVDAVRAAAEEKTVTIATAIERGLAVRGDAEQLLQIFHRLLDNAVRCTPEGGSIDVRLRARGPNVCASVRDTGIGIAPAELPGIFQPFRKPPTASGAPKRRGLGAGLAVAQHLAELHGGRIAASSEGPGRGAEFVVSLPRLMQASTQGTVQHRRDTGSSAAGEDTMRERLRMAATSRTV